MLLLVLVMPCVKNQVRADKQEPECKPQTSFPFALIVKRDRHAERTATQDSETRKKALVD